MTEEELEDGIVPEVLPEQKFQVMIKDANLDESRANYLLQNFSNHFREASDWAKKAKDIIVTNENQTVMMEMARTGRLFLSKKRQEIEKARKWMKEPALREGQAIDRIANLLKDTIIPTEEHLLRQEKFIEFKKEAEAERIRLEVEARMEVDRIAKEKADAEALQTAHIENARLRAEAEFKEEVARKLKEENEKILLEERNKALRIERELQIRKQEEMKKEADKIRENDRLLSSSEEEKLILLRNNIGILIDKLPEVNSHKYTRVVADVKSHLWLAFNMIKITEEE